jgi:DNA-binding transcriptional LysR family regulator
MTPSERLKGLEAFVFTADFGSFTAAAERLNLTNSAVGKSVARLEARLGVRLFERSTRTLSLTDAGAAYYRTCARVLTDLAEAESVLAAQRMEPTGHLRLDVPAAFGRMKVLPLLLPFFEQHPNLRPHLSFTDRFVDIVDEGIDVAVRFGGMNVWPEALGHRYLGAERLSLCASPAYLQQHGSPQSAAELDQHDAIVYGRADGSTSPWLIAQDAGPSEPRMVEAKMALGSGEAVVSAVKAGCGIAQLATWLVRDELQAGTLVRILPQLDVEGLPLNLVWPRSRQLLPKVDSIIQLLTDSLRID